MRIPNHPPNIAEIFASHPHLREELFRAFSDPKYQEVVRRVESKYLHWERVRYVARAEGLVAEIIWSMAKSSRIATYRVLPLRGAGDQRLTFNMPDAVQEEVMHIDQQLAGRLISADEQPISASQQEKFIVSALREEAIASSMLEGAATTRRDAKEMLTSGRKPRSHGERMVANNYQAISFIRDHKGAELTPEFLLEVQSMLTAGTLERAEESGRFRTNGDRVEVVDAYNNVLHTPPPAEELGTRIRKLCEFANKTEKNGFVHPVIRASVIHFQIGYDHPFCDGNGRTARALFYWAMLKAGYWLFEYIPISRLIYESPAKYQRAYLYTETDDFDVTYFLSYKARIIGRARRELGEYIARKQREVFEARKVFETDARLNHRQRDVIVRVLRSPHLDVAIGDHQGRHTIAYGTARSDLLELAEWGYLVQVQDGKRFTFSQGRMLKQEE